MSANGQQNTGVHDHPPFPASHYAMIFFGLSEMLDSGKHGDISFDDVKLHAKRGDLVTFLEKKNGGTFASGFCKTVPDFVRWYVAQIADNCLAMNGRERRKYGVETSGLCLLVSYTAELIQQSGSIRATDPR